VDSRIFPHRKESALEEQEFVSCPPEVVAFSGSDGSEDDELNAPDTTPPVLLPKGDELAVTGVKAAGSEDSKEF
jgi:hypothetical protein